MCLFLSHVQHFCDPMDCSPPGSSVHGILQARILEWVAIPFSRGSSKPRDRTQVSCIAGRFFTSLATREAQEYWSGQPIPFPVDLPDPGIELGSPALQADSSPAELPGNPRAHRNQLVMCCFYVPPHTSTEKKFFFFNHDHSFAFNNVMGTSCYVSMVT